MKKLTSIGLILLFMMVTSAHSAEARISVGLATSSIPSKISDPDLKNLESELSKSAGTPVEIRLFENESTLANWLLRFQQIDAAVVTSGFLEQQPPGALSHLADIHLAAGSKQPLALAVRLNSGNDLKTQVKKSFLDISNSSSGLAKINRIGVAGVTEPGKKISAVPSVSRTKTPEKKETVSKQVAPTKEPKPVSESSSEAESATKAKPQPAKKIAPAKKSTPVKKQTPQVKAVEEPPQPAGEKEQPKTRVSALTEPEQKTKDVDLEARETKEQEIPVDTQVEPQVDTTEKDKAQAPTPSPPKEPAEKVAQDTPRDKRLILFVVLLIIAAIVIKAVLLTLKWQHRRGSARSRQQTVEINAPIAEQKPVLPATEALDDEPLAVEEGVLGPGKVPELLKRCADLPKPVVLKVKKGHSEKLVHFAGGQVAGAFVQNLSTDSGLRWDKLGSLLIREKLITEQERDQGLALLGKEPNLRLGQALLQLGIIDLKGLRHALTRQAKATIYSLILFPEGRYYVFEDINSLPPEESVSLEVTNLIREASHHQSEWLAIRKALPNLNKKLIFSAKGKDKLEKVSLAPQQQKTLELVNGERTINDLCAESSMLDYEVYRLLYLMVKTGVLQ